MPIDIAVRRLVITKRDWEQAWAATFGRLQPAAAAPAALEQVSRLFEAKQRAGQEAAQKPSEEAKPAVILRKEEKGGNEERPICHPTSPFHKETAKNGRKRHPGRPPAAKKAAARPRCMTNVTEIYA
ncbi:MAG: hypothetical protein R3D55_25745 [Chloroflexota bacterium]